MNILARESSALNEITVFETRELYGETGRFRCMRFADDAVQGAMDLRQPERIVLGYQRAAIGLLDELCPGLHRAFIIGHGIGTIARYYGNRRVTVAEIDRMVLELSRRYFHYDGDNVKIGDGKALLAMEADGTYDAIVLDAFTQDGTPRALTTTTFFSLAAGKLARNGIILCNLFGKPNGDKRIASVFAALRELFPHAAAFGKAGQREEGNLILIGSLRAFEALPQKVAGYRPIPIEPGYAMKD